MPKVPHHKVMSMSFDVLCDGNKVDEVALVQAFCEEPTKRMIIEMITRLAEDPNFDTFLAGDPNFVEASARLAEVVHEGATKQESLIAMKNWMEAVENTALVIWQRGHKSRAPR